MMERGTELDKEEPPIESAAPEVFYEPDYGPEIVRIERVPPAECSAPEVHYKPDYGDDYKVTKRQNDDVMDELQPELRMEDTPFQVVYEPGYGDNRKTVTMTPAVGCTAPEVHYKPGYGDDYKVTKQYPDSLSSLESVRSEPKRVVYKPDYGPEYKQVLEEMLEESPIMEMETQMTDGQLDTQKDFKESKDDRLSDDDRLDSEQKVNDTLKEGDLDKIQDMITPNKLTKCKTNTLEKSLEVSYELKKLSKKQGPDADDFKSMATSVEDFAIQLLEPLKSDDMKRAIFAGKDFDRVVDKAVFYQQKKFVSHPVVYNLLKKRWVGRFYHHKYSSWMDLQWWKWIFLNVWAMFDVVLFPIVFLTLYCLHLVIGLLKKRQDVRVILMLNAKWKYASKEFEKMKDLCSSIMDGSANDGKVRFASIIRYQQQHSISEFKDLATVKADMIQTSALDETTNNFTFMDCLKKAKEMFGSVHKHNSKVLIIMTDAKSDAVMDLELIKDLKDSKTRVLSVGFGIQPEIKELVTMATNDESVFLYNRDINLENLSKQMLKSIKGHDVFDKYTSYFTTPYFIFLRDTISYLALLALHFVMCLQPSTLHLTALEWIVMLFFIGRLMMEINQVIAETDSTHLIVKEQKIRNKRMSGYFSDWWNILDVATLAVYSFLIVIRFITWAEHISVSKNRLLAVAGYMYGLNTMFLTLRVFGQIMEFSKSTGSIQIALFQIMGAVIAIFGQFLAAILAFSLVLTKIYVAEVSLNGSDNTTTHGLCADGSQSGLACWWTSAQFLAWSLMGIADLAPLSSSDDTSDMIAKLLYIIFLIMGVIMLMNMMIALLSNTYQQVEDNAFYEWSYRKTTTIRTYSDYHCVPVPFNVISLCWVLLRNVVNTVKRKCNCPCCKKTKRHQSHEVCENPYISAEFHSDLFFARFYSFYLPRSK